MVVLALDTTTRVGSVALVVDDRVVDEQSGDPARSPAERLPGELLAIAAANGIRTADVDVFAVASGPGSFTGLRIGIATVQGLALVAGRRLVAVSALDALAELAGQQAPPGTLVAAWMDAHRRDVFAALYRVDSGAPFDGTRLCVVDPPSVDAPAALLERWRTSRGAADVLFVGDGAVAYADEISAAWPVTRVLPAPPLAGAIGRLAVARALRGEAIDPADIRPLYVRRPDAEAAREKNLTRDS